MPTMILAFAWLLATATTPTPAPIPGDAGHLAAAVVAPPAPACWVGLADDASDRGPDWLLFERESDDEETDDDDSALAPARSGWPAARSPFGVATSNPHPSLRPRSALRSPILRC